jgi:hypothetical protein
MILGVNINLNRETQLTLSLPTRAGTACRQHPRHRRLRRAALWFNHMRQVVDQAREWPEAPVPAAEHGQHAKAE